MAVTASRSHDHPMAEMNTTPLIDVMLVLLIMFIITIPVATNSTDVNLGNGEAVTIAPNPIRNSVVVTRDDRILWNGQPVSTGQLASLLQATRKMPVEPELQLDPQPQASYDLAAKVTNIISVSGVTRFGFVGNERYAEFGKE